MYFFNNKGHKVNLENIKNLKKSSGLEIVEFFFSLFIFFLSARLFLLYMFVLIIQTKKQLDISTPSKLECFIKLWKKKENTFKYPPKKWGKSIYFGKERLLTDNFRFMLLLSKYDSLFHEVSYANTNRRNTRNVK